MNRSENPYRPPRSRGSVGYRRSRWPWYFVILNGLLVGVPPMLMLFGMAWAWVTEYIEQYRSGGDPIVYQHFFYFYVVPDWLVGLFVLALNLLLAVFLMMAGKLRRGRTDHPSREVH